MDGKPADAATSARGNLPRRPEILDLHCFEHGGVNYVYFPRSARLYQLSRSAARILHELCVQTPGAADPPVPTGKQTFPMEEHPGHLHLRSSLSDLLQREAALPPPAPSGHQLQDSNSFQAFSIYLSQDCNMSCCYCWSRGGSFGKTPRLMSEEDAHMATERIVALAAASTAELLSVSFYGGEPLLNFPALKSVTLGLREREAELGKRFTFTVDTNGCLLEGEVADFLALHFSQIGVSLDGREEIHDRQRPKAGGSRTWRRVVRNIASFPDKALLGLRATLTVHSDSYLETFRHLAKLGVRRIQLEYCHEPRTKGTPLSRQLIVPLERQQREMTEFLDYYVEAISHFKDIRHIPYVANVMENIIRIRRGARYTSPCGAGVNMLAIDCSGKIFPCIAFVDSPEFLMGHAGTNDPIEPPEHIVNFQVDEQDTCRNCWLRYDCAGGCHASHFQCSRDVSRPHPDYCLAMKGRHEIYLHAMALMLDKCPWHLDDVIGAGTGAMTTSAWG